MKYKTCPECDGRGEGYVYPTREQPEEYPPCDTCPGTGEVVDVESTLQDFEQRLAVVEAFVASSQREFRRLAKPQEMPCPTCAGKGVCEDYSGHSVEDIRNHKPPSTYTCPICHGNKYVVRHWPVMENSTDY